MSTEQPADFLWQAIVEEARTAAAEEPVLASFYHAAIINHERFEDAISFHLADKLNSPAVPAMLVREVCEDALKDDPDIVEKMRKDIQAYKERDPACDQFSMPLLHFKGFHALQVQRIAHWLWSKQDRKTLALYFQHQVAQIFDVDIHPGARFGSGIMIDHACGVVVGETCVVDDNVSMLHAVTLGGTGCEVGDRHPKIHQGVLLAAGAKVLGNIIVGEGAKVAAGSLVLESVPPHTTVAGVPATVVGKPAADTPALDMDQHINGVATR